MERLNFKEAAEYIGARESTMRMFVKEKRIKHYRIGNRIYFRREALDEWIAKQEVENYVG